MLPVHPKRLIVPQHYIDYRKQWNGMLAECYRMGYDPYEGDCIVFIKKDRTQLRALSGDHRGLFLIARRFEGGRLNIDHLFSSSPSHRIISLSEFALLFEGASFTVHRYVRPWK